MARRVGHLQGLGQPAEVFLPERSCYADVLGSRYIQYISHILYSYMYHFKRMSGNLKNAPIPRDAPARIRDVFQADVSNGGVAQGLCTEWFLRVYGEVEDSQQFYPRVTVPVYSTPKP